MSRNTNAETTSEELIEILIEEIKEETGVSDDDAKDLLSLLFDKMRECTNNTVSYAICACL